MTGQFSGYCSMILHSVYSETDCNRPMEWEERKWDSSHFMKRQKENGRQLMYNIRMI